MSSFSKSAPSAVVGLDIGTELIKVAEAKSTKGGVQITALGIVPTPPGAIDNGMIVDTQALGKAVGQVLRESGVKTKQVVSSISGQSSVVVRVIEVPRMTQGELVETMKWEVERHVPFSPTDIQMDFATIEKPTTPPDAPNMEILLAVAQRDAINAHVKTLFAAGLKPLAVDVQPLAIGRPLINIVDGQKPYVAGVINIGASTADVEVFEGDILAFPGPPLPIAGINFTRAISEALGVTLEEAERLKKEYAECDMAVLHGAPQDNMSYDMGTPAPAAPEPTQYDTSYQQADSDFSPFELGTPSTPPPAQPASQTADLSGDDVFDLGGPAATTEFKPTFDLDEPEVSPAPAAGQTFDLDFTPEPAAPADMGAAPMDQQFTPGVDDTFAAPAAPSAPVHDIRWNVINAIAPVLIELATEIRRSLDYYATRYQSHPEVIYLCGGTARMRNLDQFLANELGIPVQVADPVSNLPVHCPRFTPDYLREISPLFPVSIGLALREMLE